MTYKFSGNVSDHCRFGVKMKNVIVVSYHGNTKYVDADCGTLMKNNDSDDDIDDDDNDHHHYHDHEGDDNYGDDNYDHGYEECIIVMMIMMVMRQHYGEGWWSRIVQGVILEKMLVINI